MLNLIKMYGNLPLIPGERFFRIKSIGILNPRKDHILTYGMFRGTYPDLYPENYTGRVLVSPVMIFSSYDNIFRISHDDWARFDTINREELNYPIFVDTNEDWIAQLER